MGAGRGFGMAFAADQNGYPGPMHVLERLVHLLTHLKTRDLLTEEQRRTYHEARWGGR